MKVLLYSHCFHPSVGGLETVSMMLAEGFIQRQIDFIVVTKTEENGSGQLPFKVVRNPQRKQQMTLVKWADVVLFNGASLALQPWVILFRKPFVWVHQGYQVSCIDGQGWVDGRRAPLQPLASFRFHKNRKGLKWSLQQGLKLLIRRMVAKYFVAKNVAITDWMMRIQPLPRQVHIYNPFPTDRFVLSEPVTPEYDFLFLGRIVSEKGLATLLKAFSRTLMQVLRPVRLLVIGDGNWRWKMELLATELGISERVDFVGNKQGAELVRWVSKGRIAVVPSDWYEAMGGVAIELMASGRNLIVSEKGGLRECVGEAGLSFPNEDDDALAACMLQLLEDGALREKQQAIARSRVKQFAPSLSVSQYINLLKEVAR